MSETLTFRGEQYQLGSNEPQPLPDFLPLRLPAGWEEINTSPWTGRPDREYVRAYAKHGTVRVIMTCARYGDGKRWLHLSVSRKNHEIPSWAVMCEIKDLFIGIERTAYQVHPPRAKHISIHPGCLHLWTSLDGDVTPDFTGGGETI